VPSFTPLSYAWNLSGDPFEGFAIANINTGQTGPAVVTPPMLQSKAFSFFYRSIGGPGSTPSTAEANNAQTITCVVTCLDPKGNQQVVTGVATVYT
jgi:hypothetical protein